METFGLTLLGVMLVTGVGSLLWRRHRVKRLPVVSASVRCPLHECHADVSVRTDPQALVGHRYVEVVGCSLLSDAAVALPEQRAYLPDSPPCEVLLEAARKYPVYTTEVSCPQSCVFALNAAAPAVAPPTLACASGASDAIDLMRQADPRSADSRLLWHSSL